MLNSKGKVVERLKRQNKSTNSDLWNVDINLTENVLDWSSPRKNKKAIIIH